MNSPAEVTKMSGGTCQLPENSEVELIVQGPVVIPPGVADPQERARIRKRVVERMRQNPIPAVVATPQAIKCCQAESPPPKKVAPRPVNSLP